MEQRKVGSVCAMQDAFAGERLQHSAQSLSHRVVWNRLIQLEMSGSVSETKETNAVHTKSRVAKFQTLPPGFAIGRRVYDTSTRGVAIYHSLPNGSFTPAIRSPLERSVGCMSEDAPASMAR